MVNSLIRLNFSVISILVLLFLVELSSQVSHVSHYESLETFKKIIEKVSKHEEIQEGSSILNPQESTCRQGTCCICQKQFKNSSFVELHMFMHHSVENLPEYEVLNKIFDKRLNSQYRFESCLDFLKFFKTKEKQESRIGLKNSESIEIVSSIQKIGQYFSKLEEGQEVDVCILAAYGGLQQPLWIYWIKGVLTVVFIIFCALHYSDMYDQYRNERVKQKNKQ